MELRAKSGILRGREFLMKDFYSFHANEEDRDKYYDFMSEVYKKIFGRVGIGNETFYTLAGGGTFSKYSHEFQTVTDAGEDTIYICEKCKMAINMEIMDEQKICLQCKGKDFIKKKSIEVGNIFKLKNKFAEDFKLMFRDRDGSEKIVVTGCYGIGLGRLMGTIVEINHDDKGIIWPEAVAPFKVHLIKIKSQISNLKINEFSDAIYKDLQKNNIEVLYDDREDATAGEKFADADLLGIPYRMIVSEKTLSQDKIEIKKRNEKEAKLISKNDSMKYVR
jgi:prolyl-tRNA synthetase